MRRFILILILFIAELYPFELVVVGDKNFPEENLTRLEIKAIFLTKKRFIHDKKILVMNHKPHHLLRHCFEKNILEKTERSLERYWRKAYYQGRKPPKIISSTNMLFLYLQSVHPTIGYSDFNATIDKEIKILYQINCGERDD